MYSLKKDGENREPRPDRRDPKHDQPPREHPDVEPTQPVGDPEPAVGPIKTTPGEATRPLRPPPPAETSVERAVCKMCGKSFDSTQGLVDHEITTHPNVSVPPKHSSSDENGSAA